jgi:hypothetical protein
MLDDAIMVAAFVLFDYYINFDSMIMICFHFSSTKKICPWAVGRPLQEKSGEKSSTQILVSASALAMM